MNEELTNEAAEMIGRYIDGGKEYVLKLILKNGGIVKKKIDTEGGRLEGFELVYYYYESGLFICYDPARLKMKEG